MELWNGCYDELNLDSGRNQTPAAARSATRSNALGGPEPRYDRFEPITVRAATRVLQLQQAGVVTAPEARFYLSELVTMDRHAGPGALRSLTRLAQRHAADRSPVSRAGRRPALHSHTSARAAAELSAVA
ncbi:MAG: hypothetical protein ACO1SX_06665 [Actinomycetota bacterium]